MNAHEVNGAVKMSCGCSDEIKAVSMAEATAALYGPGICRDCGKEYVVSVNFKKVGKK